MNQGEDAAKRMRIAEDMGNGDLGSAVGFTAMCCIQVKWLLSDDDAAKDKEEEEVSEEAVWWDAIVVGRTSRQHMLDVDGDDGGGGEQTSVPIYEIRYEARPPMFPHVEIAQVCVLDQHFLLDVATGGELPWRHQGSDWDEPEDEDEGEEQERIEAEKLVSFFIENIVSQSPAAEEFVLRCGDNRTQAACESKATEFVQSIILDLAEKHSAVLEGMEIDRQIAIMERVGEMRERMIDSIASILMQRGEFNLQDTLALIASLGDGY